MKRFLSLRTVISLPEFLSGWFHSKQYQLITHSDVERFFAYALYGRTLSSLSHQDYQTVSNYVSLCEVTWNATLPSGDFVHLPFMAHTLEPLQVVHKPLAVHLASEAAGWVVSLYLWCGGFVGHHHQGLPYWIHKPLPTAAAAHKPPVLFLHGVGFGLVPYLPFIDQLMRSFPDRCIIVIEFVHVSMRLAAQTTTMDNIATSIAVGVLHKHDFKTTCVVAHSFGSFIASRLTQTYPQVVHSLALLDPVCLMTCYPQLLYTFIYKPFELAAFGRLSGIYDVLRWLCSRDLFIAEVDTMT